MSTGEDRRWIESVLWRRLDDVGLEHCRLWVGREQSVLEGRVLVAEAESPLEIGYTVACNRKWETQAVDVVLIGGESSRVLELRRDEQNRWWRDDARLPDMDGLVDVDLSVTPATNTLPIGRLGLDVGASAAVDAVWVRFPELTLERLPQRYTRLDARRYRYESGGAFVAELEVDVHDLVVRYGELWERVAGVEEVAPRARG